MRTEAVGSSAKREDARRGGAGWQAHTFSDGVCSIALTGPLDEDAAECLQARLRALMERGSDRLIVDVSAVREPSGEEPLLLAEVFEAHTPGCEVVVVVAPGSTLAGLLSAGAVVATSLTDARRLLGSHVGAGGRLAPCGAISAGERHALAVRQALRWAGRSAGTGDFDSALAALATIERVEGSLPQRWQEHREAWLLASGRQV